jgi:hypothetical protein
VVTSVNQSCNLVLGLNGKIIFHLIVLFVTPGSVSRVCSGCSVLRIGVSLSVCSLNF